MSRSIPAPKQQAASLLAQGKTIRETALVLSQSEDTILSYLRDPRVMAEYQDELLSRQAVTYARAVEKIGAMLENENTAVVQKAAHEALEQFERAALSQKEREIIIKVEGMPEIGMPEALDGAD